MEPLNANVDPPLLQATVFTQVRLDALWPRLTRDTVTTTMSRAAHPSGRARCGADAGCSAIKHQSLSPLSSPYVFAPEQRFLHETWRTIMSAFLPESRDTCILMYDDKKEVGHKNDIICMRGPPFRTMKNLAAGVLPGGSKRRCNAPGAVPREKSSLLTTYWSKCTHKSR